VVFGPVPRSYEHSLPKKVRGAALRSALSYRLAEGDITAVDSIDLEGYKTQRVVEILRGLSLGEVSVLIVIETPDEHLQRSARNLPNVTVLPVKGVNVYDVLRHQKMLVTKSALAAIESRLAGGSREPGT
jgi:large subunit ribosomal protein L4